MCVKYLREIQIPQSRTGPIKISSAGLDDNDRSGLLNPFPLGLQPLALSFQNWLFELKPEKQRS